MDTDQRILRPSIFETERKARVSAGFRAFGIVAIVTSLLFFAL